MKRYTSSYGDEFARILNKRYEGSRVMVWEGADCHVLILKLNNETYILGLGQGDEAYYVKILPSHVSIGGDYSCSRIMAVPFGLYVFGNTLEELVERIDSKLGDVELIDRLYVKDMEA